MGVITKLSPRENKSARSSRLRFCWRFAKQSVPYMIVTLNKAKVSVSEGWFVRKGLSLDCNEVGDFFGIVVPINALSLGYSCKFAAFKKRKN